MGCQQVICPTDSMGRLGGKSPVKQTTCVRERGAMFFQEGNWPTESKPAGVDPEEKLARIPSHVFFVPSPLLAKPNGSQTRREGQVSEGGIGNRFGEGRSRKIARTLPLLFESWRTAISLLETTIFPLF